MVGIEHALQLHGQDATRAGCCEGAPLTNDSASHVLGGPVPPDCDYHTDMTCCDSRGARGAITLERWVMVEREHCSALHQACDPSSLGFLIHQLRVTTPRAAGRHVGAGWDCTGAGWWFAVNSSRVQGHCVPEEQPTGSAFTSHKHNLLMLQTSVQEGLKQVSGTGHSCTCALWRGTGRELGKWVLLQLARL